MLAFLVTRATAQRDRPTTCRVASCRVPQVNLSSWSAAIAAPAMIMIVSLRPAPPARRGSTAHAAPAADLDRSRPDSATTSLPPPSGRSSGPQASTRPHRAHSPPSDPIIRPLRRDRLSGLV